MGPIAGGFVVEKVGVKWIFIIVSIVCAVASLVAIPFLRETYAPIIQLRRIKHSQDPEKAARDYPELFKEQKGLSDIWLNLTRPFLLLFGSYVCFILSLYMALCGISPKSLSSDIN